MEEKCIMCISIMSLIILRHIQTMWSYSLCNATPSSVCLIWFRVEVFVNILMIWPWNSHCIGAAASCYLNPPSRQCTAFHSLGQGMSTNKLECDLLFRDNPAPSLPVRDGLLWRLTLAQVYCAGPGVSCWSSDNIGQGLNRIFVTVAGREADVSSKTSFSLASYSTLLSLW